MARETHIAQVKQPRLQQAESEELCINLCVPFSYYRTLETSLFICSTCICDIEFWLHKCAHYPASDIKAADLVFIILEVGFCKRWAAGMTQGRCGCEYKGIISPSPEISILYIFSVPSYHPCVFSEYLLIVWPCIEGCSWVQEDLPGVLPTEKWGVLYLLLGDTKRI